MSRLDELYQARTKTLRLKELILESVTLCATSLDKHHLQEEEQKLNNELGQIEFEILCLEEQGQ